MNLTHSKVSIFAPEDQLAEVMRVVDSKMRRLKHLQMLIELLSWDSKATGNFMSCNPLLADDHSMKNSKDHLDRVVMSFFDLNEFVDVAGFLVWGHMLDRGWLVFDFNAIKKRTAYVDFQQRNLSKHGNKESEANHKMKGEVRVQHVYQQRRDLWR